MGEIFTMTLTNVIKMLLFIGVGYILSHTGRFPKDASKSFSTLATMLLLPAYNIKNLSQNFTVDKVGEKLVILGFGILCVVAVLFLARLLAKWLESPTWSTALWSMPIRSPITHISDIP